MSMMSDYSDLVLTLNNGLKMPQIGLGTREATGDSMTKVIKTAMEVGYRHFDCAWFYGNEMLIGEGIKHVLKSKLVERQDIFVTTKLWNNYHSKKKVVPMIKDSLQNLQLKYVDLYLIHWPFAFNENAPLWPSGEEECWAAMSDIDYVETWCGMEECVKLGLAKSIGLSNFNSKQVQRVLDNCTIKPVVNQIEVTPRLNQKKLIKFCHDRQVQVSGHSPLGHGIGHTNVSAHTHLPTSSIFNPDVIRIAQKYRKTAPQVILNYLLSQEICVIPKSVNKTRMEENFECYDFTLNPEDIDFFDSLNDGKRTEEPLEFKTHPHYPFNIPY